MENNLIKKLIDQTMCFDRRCLLLGPLLLLVLLTACSPNEPDKETTNRTLGEESLVEAENLKEFDVETALSVQQILAAYLNQVSNDFSELENYLDLFSTRTNELLNNPTESTLATLQESWLSSHTAFEQTAVHRYLSYRAASEEDSLRLFQLQYQLNQWPILAGYIDSVEGYAESGIVHDINVELYTGNLRQQNGLFDVTEVTLGFHVIEFLLWGEPERSSQRIAADFKKVETLTAQQQENELQVDQLENNRRREMLRLTTNILLEDFAASTVLWDQTLAKLENAINDLEPEALLSLLLDSTSSMLTEELLVKSLYPILNNEFEVSLQSPYSQTSQNSVAAQMRGVESLILEISTNDGTTLDRILVSLSPDFESSFYQNLDAGKACLIILYNTIGASDFSGPSAKIEFEAVECINLITNIIDQLDQIELRLPAYRVSI